MKKFPLLLLWLMLSLTGTSHAYRDKEHGTFLTRDPLGYKDGPNLYCYVQGNPITRIDALGLYGYDMHYLGAYMAMAAAGVPKDRAANIAYYSAYPDLDGRYNAIECAIKMKGVDRAAKIHLLTGSSKGEILQMRETLSKQIPNDSDKVAGVKMHRYGDTFGHLRLKYSEGKKAPAARHKGIGPLSRPRKPLKDGSHNSTYLFDLSKGALGHAPDMTDPDQVRYRPELAKEYIDGIFKMFGGTDLKQRKIIEDAVDKVHSDNMNMKEAYSYLQGIAENSFGLDPSKSDIKAFDEWRERVIKDNSVEPTDMEKILRNP